MNAESTLLQTAGCPLREVPKRVRAGAPMTASEESGANLQKHFYRLLLY
jgi:hypothetical protein